MRAGAEGRVALLAGLAAGLLALGLVGFLGWRSWTTGPLTEARAAWAGKGDADAALAALERAASRPGLDAPERELEGLIRLAQGDHAGGARALEASRAAGGTGDGAAAALESTAAQLLAGGRETELATLCEHARQALSAPSATLVAHEGIARHAMADLEGARQSYRAALDAGLDGSLKGLIEGQLGLAAEQARTRRVPVVLARGGEVLAWRDARTRQLVAAPELEALLGGADVSALPGLQDGDLDGRVRLSLDADLQREAVRVFRGEVGAFVALSVDGGEILAAAAEAKPNLPLVPFAPVFEPGSTLKVLTMAAWLDDGLPDDRVVPYRCKGNDFVIDGEILYDWAPHGELPNLERALSQSCNTVFARMGMELGEDRLRQALRPLGFGASLIEGDGPREGNGFDLAGGGRVRTGALAAGPLGERRLARTSMGLDDTRVSTLQAAAMALVFANEGRLRSPRLVLERMNAVGAELPAAGSGGEEVQVFSAETARRVGRAMRQVVEDADGTGRGARSAGIPVALKTGTTGGDGNPLSAAFVGYMPADRPDMAFGMFVRDSGRSLDVSRRVLGPFLEDVWRRRSGAAVRTN